MKLKDILIQLEGKEIQYVKDSMEEGADCGLTIMFTDGTKLSFGYSGCEGSTYYNEEEIQELS